MLPNEAIQSDEMLMSFIKSEEYIVMGEERPFRKAALGGFNRRDVIEYIEELLRQHETDTAALALKDKKISELEERIAQAEHEREAASSIIVESDDPDAVLSQVDRILQSYLGKEA